MNRPEAARTAVRRTCWHGVALAAALAATAPLHAQDATSRPGAPPISDLAAENLKRVAAAPSEIEPVLRREAGLLLELKRWVANDATAHGQVVNDAELSDGNIFDRLESDTEFRSVATRLLERYGFLVARLNPDSPAGKEQDIFLRERALQTSSGTQSRPQSTSGEPLPVTEASCTLAGCLHPSGAPAIGSSGVEGTASPSTRQASPEGTSPNSPSEPPSVPEDQSPAKAPDGPLLLTALGNSADLTPIVQSRSDSLAPDLAASYANMQMSAEPAPMAKMSVGPNSYDSAGGGSSLSVSVPSDHPAPTRPLEMQPAREASGPLSAPPEFTRRANPYPDIPSLYDMYQQATSRNASPERFGEDVFHDGWRDPRMLPTDLPVGPDYVVGPGDSLTIDLWGGVSQRLNRVVDGEGRVALPEVGPVLVSGRSLGDVQHSLEQALRTQFRDVSADVSLARLRTIRVYVVGDVVHPGAYDISSLSTPLNALFAAGGPTKAGSLRVVRHFRGKELLEEVDLYDLLLHGVSGRLQRLENGDTVLVPPPGSQITVEGAVRRPAVYELAQEKTLSDALALAGGVLPTATLEHVEVERVVAHEKRTMLSLDLPGGGDDAAAREKLASFAIQDGDTVHLFPIAPYNTSAVYLDGHVLHPGRYSYRPGMLLSDLLSSYADLLPEPAARYAEIIRLTAPDYRPSVESFDLGKALANPATAPALQPLDTVRIFSRYDFEDAPIVLVGGEVRRPGSYRTSGQVHVADAVELAGGLTPQAELGQAQVFRYLPGGELNVTTIDLQAAISGNPLDNLLLGPRDQILIHRNPAQVDPPVVNVRGEVAQPGRYPLSQGMRVSDLLGVSGGLKRSADIQTADLTEYLATKGTAGTAGAQHEIQLAAAMAGSPSDDLPLHDGDVLTVRQIPGWNDVGASVTVRGEVAHPGTYGIRPGERLSSVLQRAGGFLPTAYPEGTILTRAEIRDLQGKSRQELITRIEQDAATSRVSLSETAGDQAALQQAVLAQHERVVEALRNAQDTGRLVVRVSGDLGRMAGSADDPELRADDRIVVPKRPNFIVVTGQVYNSNAIAFAPRKTVGWYLERAGGATGLADRKAIFVLRASGEVIGMSGSGWWTGGVSAVRVEPGDVIVVPERAAIGSSVAWKNLLAIGQFTQAAAFSALAARSL